MSWELVIPAQTLSPKLSLLLPFWEWEGLLKIGVRVLMLRHPDS